MTDHLFRESEPGFVKHTAATKALAVVPLLAPWSLMGMSEVGPAKMHVSFQITMDFERINFNIACRWSMRLQNGQSPRSPSTRYAFFMHRDNCCLS